MGTRSWVPWAWTAAVVASALLASPPEGAAWPRANVAGLDPARLASLELSPYAAGTEPPAFRLPAADGRIVSLAELRGQVVLLNFWATWCLECRPEMPAFQTLHRRLGARGLAVVGINTREAAAVVQGYARKLGLSYPLALDRDGRVAHRYGVIGLPTTFLLDREGRAVALAVGARDWASAAAVQILEALVAAPPAEPERAGGAPAVGPARP